MIKPPYHGTSSSSFPVEHISQVVFGDGWQVVSRDKSTGGQSIKMVKKKGKSKRMTLKQKYKIERKVSLMVMVV